MANLRLISITTIFLFLTMLILINGAILNRSNVISLASQDGFELIFDTHTKKFSFLAVPGYTVDLSQRPDLGVYLSDPSGIVLLDASANPVKDYQMNSGSLHLIREDSAQKIETEEVWTVYEKHIELEATITHTGNVPGSRAIEACLQLPLDLVGKQWHHHLHQSETIQQRSAPYQTLLTKLIDIGSFGNGSHHLKSDLNFNLHGLNLIGNDNFGLALAIHPEKPAAYYVRYDPTRESYEACFHLGIYEDHQKYRDKVSFNLAFFFPDEPEWGLRSALKKYVSIYPESFTGHLGAQSGMIAGGIYNYNQYPNPKEFHIGAMWDSFKAQNAEHGVYNLVYVWPTGFVDRGMRLTTSSVSNGSDPSWEADIAACLSLYQDYDQGQNPFEQTCTGPFANECIQINPGGRVYGPVYKIASEDYYDIRTFQVLVSNFPNYLFGQFDIYRPFSNSLLQDESGRHINAMSYASAMSELSQGSNFKRCFFDGFNPDPGLDAPLNNQPSPDPAPMQTQNFGHLNLEIAKRAIGLYGTSYLYEHPFDGLNLYNGVAVDTVGAYLRQDFNPDMLRIASLPLSYDPASGRVVSLEHLNLAAFLKALQASLPPDAALSMNGYPISGILGQDIDFFMAEMGSRTRNGQQISELYDEDLQTRLRRLHRMRMGAYQRPYTFWVSFDRAGNEQELLEQMRQYLPLYTAQGMYIMPSRYGYQREKFFWGSGKPQNPAVIQEYKRHLDAVHSLTVAGWEPVPFAKGFDQAGSIIPDILIERFGNRCFTLYNGRDQTINFRVNIEWGKIDLSTPPDGVKDWETGQILSSTVSGDTLTVSGLSLASHTVQILEIEGAQPSDNELSDWAVYLPLVFRNGQENSRCNG